MALDAQGSSSPIADLIQKVVGGGSSTDDSAGVAAPAVDPYADLAKINERMDRVITIDKYQRSLFEREWFRNILFYVGQQWIIYEKSKWRPKQLPMWYPRAQTNKFAEKTNDLISQLMQTNPPIRYIPALPDNPDSIATAEIGERVREVIYEEAKIDDKRPELAAWLILTGNGFVIPYYDDDAKYGTTSMSMQQCVQCGAVLGVQDLAESGGACPDCLEQGINHSDFVPAVDPAGGEMKEDVPIGAICADVCSPFEIRLDHRIRNIEDHKRFVRVRRYDMDFAKEHWSDYADKLGADGGDDMSEYYLDVLSHITASFGASGGAVGGSGAASKNPKITAYEFYELPSEDFPEGIRAVRLGKSADTIVEAGPLKTEYKTGGLQGQKFLPIDHFGGDLVPGRFWRKTRMDDVIPLQIFRNVVEANLRLTSQRMGNGVWLDPKGSGVDIITGEPGQHIRYNPVSLGGTTFAKPERVPAELNNVQPMIILINKIDDSIERVSGTFFLQGGDTPPGVTAASALAYLGERAQKAMSPLMREWAKGWKRFDEMALEIARAHWTEPRLRVIAGRNKKWETQQFSEANLQGAVTMTIDYENLFPKSQATERATIQQLQAMGVINPQDPEQQWKILEAFGETKLKGSTDLDMQEAMKESERFLKENKLPRLIPMVQNSTVHLLQHADFAKGDEFKELPQPQQDVWIAHIQAHVADIVARRMAFSGGGFDPDTPGTDEITSGMAEYASMAAQQMGGGQGGPGGPGAGGAGGAPGSAPPSAPGMKPPPVDATAEPIGTPDIAGGTMPPGIRKIQQPRAIGNEGAAA